MPSWTDENGVFNAYPELDLVGMIVDASRARPSPIGEWEVDELTDAIPTTTGIVRREATMNAVTIQMIEGGGRIIHIECIDSDMRETLEAEARRIINS